MTALPVGVAAKKAKDHDVPRQRQRLASTRTVATVFFFFTTDLWKDLSASCYCAASFKTPRLPHVVAAEAMTAVIIVFVRDRRNTTA